MIRLVLAGLAGLIAFLPLQAGADCTRPLHAISPPPIVRTLVSTDSSVRLAVPGATISSIAPTGSMRPAIQDGSKIIWVKPDITLLAVGRVIIFWNRDRLVAHRIYAEGVDSPLFWQLLGRGESGWTLDWDGKWYEPGQSPPPPPIEKRWWHTWGDNNCLPDFFQVRYSDIVGIVVAVIE